MRSSLTECWGGLMSAREERHVDVQDVRAADVLAELPDGLEERQALDPAPPPADLDDDDIRIAVAGQPTDALLDLVRDVRDDLDGPARAPRRGAPWRSPPGRCGPW